MDPIFDTTLRLLIALLLGGAIGIEREFRAKDAGFRTHFLVSLGSALFCIVSQYGFGAEVKDASRVAAQVVSGIGFLGAGTIIFQKNVIRGLTTAAGLWVTAAIGLACGTGMYAEAAVGTILILLGLEVLNSFLPNIGSTVVSLQFSSTSRDSIKLVMSELKKECLSLSSYQLKERRTSLGVIYDVSIEMKVKRGNHNERILQHVAEFDDVTIASIE